MIQSCPTHTSHCLLISSVMLPELQKPRITEIKVRMDCNGCVQKIKKALHGINGICDLYFDFPQQKITIVGWADLETIAKAIKKTRKSAIICSHTEPPDEPAQPSEPANQGDAPAPESANPPPTESANPPPTEPQPAEAAPAVEPPKDQAPQENTKPEAKPSPDAAEASASQPVQPIGPKDVEEVHVIYHHPSDYGYRYAYNHNIGHGYTGQWHSYSGGPGFRPEAPPVYHSSGPGFRPEQPPPPPVYHSRPEQPPPPPVYHSSGPGFRPEPPPPPPPVYHSSGPGFRPGPPSPPVYVTHSYNTHRPSPYVTGYDYVRLPPQYTHYNQMERYIEDYHQGNGKGNVTAIFSDENPNACTIV